MPCTTTMAVSRSSRPRRTSISALRTWCYFATQPYVEVACPHGVTREHCAYRQRDGASKCPSSRALHHVRSGSITWQFNAGVPPEVVAERVNASPAIIAKHYDAAVNRERLEERRRPYVDGPDIASSDVSNSDSDPGYTSGSERTEGWYGDGGI